MLQMAVYILIPRLSSRYSCNICLHFIKRGRYKRVTDKIRYCTEGLREWVCIHHKKWKNMKCVLFTGYFLGKGIKTLWFGPGYYFIGWILMRQGWLITGSCRDAGHQYGKLNPWAVGSSELASESESNFVTTEKKTSCDFALWKVHTFEPCLIYSIYICILITTCSVLVCWWAFLIFLFKRSEDFNSLSRK